MLMSDSLPHRAWEPHNASESPIQFKCSGVGPMGVIRTEVIMRPQQRRLGHREAGGTREHTHNCPVGASPGWAVLGNLATSTWPGPWCLSRSCQSITCPTSCRVEALSRAALRVITERWPAWTFSFVLALGLGVSLELV